VSILFNLLQLEWFNEERGARAGNNVHLAPGRLPLILVRPYTPCLAAEWSVGQGTGLLQIANLMHTVHG
jgi:hypothetical protein